MKKYFIPIISLCLIFIKGNGQANLPPVFEILTDTALTTEIPAGYWKMLEDKEGNLTFQQVIQSPVADQFHFNLSKNNDFNFAIHTYWFCYRIRNVMNREIEIGFGVDITQNQGNEQSRFYINRDGKWNEYENGLLSPRRKMNGLVLNNYVPLLMKPGEELIVYNRVYNSYNTLISPSKYFIGFSDAKKILKQSYVQDETLYVNGVHNSILFGILLFACIINFFFFLIVKERVYLWFALYVLFLGIGRMLFESYFVFLREYRVLWAGLYIIVYTSTFFLLVAFIRSLFNTRILLPRWDNFLRRFNWTNLIISFLGYIIPCLFPATREPALYRLMGLISIWTGILLVTAVVITLFIIRNIKDNSNKVLARLILPVFCVWGLAWSMDILYAGFGIVFFSADLMSWLDLWWPVIESVCLCWLVMSYSWILLQRFRKLQNRIVQQEIEKEKEKTLLIEQKRIELEKTVEERTAELKQSIDNLQSTQHQLIQSEKMASLGELTAGIAHEIQNPLNFVNNFSEINKELIDEASQAIRAGNSNEAIELLSSVKNNEEKISSHGQRADSIVKSMLQHSRTSTGQKEPTDINALADEYLRLSYHGVRAKDKSFNATLQTDFDPGIGKIDLVAQDLGRVLLNLYNNAFYSVNEKKEKSVKDYEPMVSVRTRKSGQRVEISVMDNGNGIPKRLLDKIFQPFFTTKPAGQGTGLGLSMSYDIIKAHGGELTVETKEGEGTEFLIRMPITVHSS
jgi:two-component system, NtrC family, sensor kinase